MDRSTVSAGAEARVVDTCYICLSPFEEQTVGSLEGCKHVFCLECILQWSQTANTCPVDRITFAFIHQRRCPGGDILKKIKVNTPKKDADDDDDDDDDEEESRYDGICDGCGRSDDRRHRLRVLVCIQCQSGYHMDCLTPPINAGPDGYWICPECVAIPQHTDSVSAVEEDISDGELTDLLAEVDEAASTSSRLRPSTVNRPGNTTTQRRQSQRIQSRGGAEPDPPPQTSWHVPKYLLRASKPAVAADQDATCSATSSSSVKKKTRRKRKRTN